MRAFNFQITKTPVFKLFDQQIKLATQAKILGLKISPSLSLKKPLFREKTASLSPDQPPEKGTKILLHLYKSYIRQMLETGYVATAAAP